MKVKIVIYKVPTVPVHFFTLKCVQYRNCGPWNGASHILLLLLLLFLFVILTPEDEGAYI